MSWPSKRNSKHRAVFHVPMIENEYGVWHASLCEKQYGEFMGAKPSQIATVIELRAQGISLAMQQRYWDTYHVGKR